MTLYISKKCMDCNKLLVELNEEGLSGIFNIILIDSNPYPNVIKSVPAIINDGNLYQGQSVITFINQLLSQFNNKSTNKKVDRPEKKEEEKRDELGCYGGSCLDFSSFSDEKINDYNTYGLINDDNNPPNIKLEEGKMENPKQEKQKTFDDDYNRMMSERNQFK